MDNATSGHVDLSFREGVGPLLYVVLVSTFFFMARSAMSPLLLDVEEAFGVGHAQSSGLMVLFTVGYALTMFASGFASARLTHRRLIPFAGVVAAVGTSVLAVLLLGLTGGRLRILMVFVQPAVGAIFFPAGFAAVSSLLPAESRNVGISMVLPISVVLGVGVLPAFAQGFAILGAATTVLGATALLVRFYGD
jgi:MFS family permease